MRDIALFLENDDAHVDGGHALLFLTGAAGLSGDRAFIVKRNDGAQPYLTATGWQAKAIPAEGLSMPVTKDGDDLVVRLGPQLTRYFNSYEVYKFEFRGLGIQGNIAWDGIEPFTGDYEAKAPERGEADFTLLDSGAVQIDGYVEKDGSREILKRDIAAGEPILGVAYSDVKSARAGRIAFDLTAGTGEIISRSGPQPGEARFTTREDGHVHIQGHFHGAAGRTPVEETLGPDGKFYSASHAELARNQSGKLIFDAGTGEVQIQADVPEPAATPVAPPPPKPEPKPTSKPPSKGLFGLSPLILAAAGVGAIALLGLIAFLVLSGSDPTPPTPADPEAVFAEAQQLEEDNECARAALLYDEAFRLDHPPAAVVLAEAYAPGPDFDGCITISPDAMTSLRYIQKACELGAGDAVSELFDRLKTDLTVLADEGQRSSANLLSGIVPRVEAACN